MKTGRGRYSNTTDDVGTPPEFNFVEGEIEDERNEEIVVKRKVPLVNGTVHFNTLEACLSLRT